MCQLLILILASNLPDLLHIALINGVVILRILYCSLWRYERHTSVRRTAVVDGACGAMCPYWSVLV